MIIFRTISLKLAVNIFHNGLSQFMILHSIYSGMLLSLLFLSLFIRLFLLLSIPSDKRISMPNTFVSPIIVSLLDSTKVHYYQRIMIFIAIRSTMLHEIHPQLNAVFTSLKPYLSPALQMALDLNFTLRVNWFFWNTTRANSV